MTQTKLALDADVARATIVKVEKGEEGVRLFLVYRLAKALGVHPRELLPEPTMLTPVADLDALRKSTEGVKGTREVLMKEFQKKEKT